MERAATNLACRSSEELAPTALALRRDRLRVVDFFELTKPRMNFLVVVTTMVGFYLAGRGTGTHWLLLLHTLAGTALTAASASVLNHWMEAHLDARMPRTRNRPLPTGRVLPAEALVFGVGLGVAGIVYLLWLVNPLTAGLGALTHLTYVLIYTPLKRLSSLNTLIGAIPGAIPPLMGFTAVDNALSPGAWLLFAVLFLWQMPHFLAIAMLYRDDYAAAGFKMLPVVDQTGSATGRMVVLYILALIPVTLLVVPLRITSPAYLLAALSLGAVFLWYGCKLWRSRDRADARKLFYASIIYLPLLLASMLIFKL
ncbi:MAG: heme o synthase [Phycisphaerae bacterium]|nr:heme o synthase [Phycisphaerae bacterium]MDW8261588.1 heme o synthase [Phycisphaerales bacterium]